MIPLPVDSQSRLRIRSELFFLVILIIFLSMTLTLRISSDTHADTLNSPPPDASDPRTTLTTSAQFDVVRAFTHTLRDYESANMSSLGSDVTLQAQAAFNTAPRDAFIQTAKEDIAERGFGTLVNPRVLMSPDGHYAWLRTSITYSKGGSNTILVLMVHDFFQWRVANIQLT